jgi:hypothetical protein
MSLSALDSIDDALQATKGLLLPFDRGTWFRLAVVMIFVGGGGASAPNTSNVGSFGDSGGFDDGGVAGPPTGDVQFPDVTGELVALLAIFVVAVLLVGLALAAIGGVMEFVFVESLGSEEVRLRSYFFDNLGRGLRLFGFRIGFGLLNLLVLGGVLAGLVAATVGFSPEGWTTAGLFGLAFLALPVLFLDAVVVGTILGFTTMFVVPVMLLEERGVLSAWRRFWPTLRAEWKEFLAYWVMGFILSLVTGIAQGIIGFVLLLVVAIPFLVVGGILFFVLQGASGAGMAVLLVLAVLFFVVVFVLGLLAKVPFQSFLRYYALFVLGDTNEDFDAVADVRDSVRES